MARNHKRKTDREIISHDVMKEAVRLVRNGTSLRKVAKDKCVSKSALQRYVTKAKNTPLEDMDKISFQANYSVNKIFRDYEEMSLKTYIMECSKMNYGLTYDAIRVLAYDLAMKNNLTVPDVWNKNKMAGIDWLKGFMSRHKDLSLRRPE